MDVRLFQIIMMKSIRVVMGMITYILNNQTQEQKPINNYENVSRPLDILTLLLSTGSVFVCLVGFPGIGGNYVCV